MQREDARKYIEYCREDHGGEGLPATPKEVAEIAGQEFAYISDEKWHRVALKNYIAFTLPRSFGSMEISSVFTTWSPTIKSF